jgi:homoserine kinase type II
MAQFRTLDADDVRAILQALERPAHAYVRHDPIAVGTINTNLCVETAAGRLFVRINEGKAPDDIRREADIVAHAASRGVPTPVPLRTPAGEPFVRWSGELASVFPWVEGRTLRRPELLPAHAAAVGRGLAALHRASPGFPDQRPGRYEPDEIARRFAHVSGLGRPELARAVAVLGPELEALAGARAAHLTTGIIHGDLFMDNVLFTDAGPAARLAALIDFEQASWGRLAYDLAVTTLAFGFGRDDFRADVVRALIEAYAAERPPTAAERAAFGAELRFAACRFAVTRITDVHLKRDAGAPPGKDFNRYLARLASLRDHLAAADGLFELPG